MLLKPYPVCTLSTEATPPSETGSKNTNQKDCFTKDLTYLSLSLTKPKSKLDQNICGYGLQLSQKIGEFSHWIYQKKEPCLLLRDLLQVWSRYMENIWFQQMAGHGIHRPADFFTSNTISIHLWRKA